MQEQNMEGLLDKFLESVAAVKRAEEGGPHAGGPHVGGLLRTFAKEDEEDRVSFGTVDGSSSLGRHSISEGVKYNSRSVNNHNNNINSNVGGCSDSDSARCLSLQPITDGLAGESSRALATFYSSMSGSSRSLNLRSLRGDSLVSNLSGDEDEGPIMAMQLLTSTQKCPPGFKKVAHVGGKPADLNKGQPGKSLFLCYQRQSSTEACVSAAPITAIAVFHESKEEFLPPGFEIVCSTTTNGQFSADISMGNGLYGRMFLCVCRGEGPPLVDLCVAPPQHRGLLSDVYGMLERTPLGFNAVLNARNKGNAMCLCVRRDAMATLGMLMDYAQPGHAAVTPRSESERAALLPSLSTPRDSSILNSGSPCKQHAESFKMSISSLDLEQRHVSTGTVAALVTMLRSCYSYDVPSMVIGLHFLEKAVKLGMAQLAPGGAGTDKLSLGDVIIKAAADCTELCLDVLFGPAMRVLCACVEAAGEGLLPLSAHFALKATLCTSCFFNMLPMQSYTSGSGFRDASSHRYRFGVSSSSSSSSSSSTSVQSQSWDEESLVRSPSSTNPFNSSQVLDDSHSSSTVISSLCSDVRSYKNRQHGALDMLGEMSSVSLQDLNFLLRCPTFLFDLIANRAASSTHFKQQLDTNSDEVVSSSLHVVDELNDTMRGDVNDLEHVMQVTDDAVKRLVRHSNETAMFARDIHQTLCKRLGLSRVQQNAVMALVWLSQAASMPLNTLLRKGRLLNAELNQRLAAMALAKEFLVSVGAVSDQSFFQSQVFCYQLRRITFNAALYNVGQVARLEAALPLLSELWKSARCHLKVEMAVVLEKVLLMVLKDKCSPPQLRRFMLENVVSWFGMNPGDLVELFLNFENDPAIREWNSFQGLIGSLCDLADPNNYLNEADADCAAINAETQYDALTSLVALLRSLTDMSGNLRLIGMSKLIGNGNNQDSSDGDENSGESKIDVVRERHNLRAQNTKEFEKAFELARSKGVRKAIELLASKGLLEETPTHIAAFLHLYHVQLDPRQVGSYLGSKAGDSFMTSVRLRFTRALNFGGKTFEQCLRLFLEKGHFFLPGEAQQVEALLEAFAACYVDENHDEFSPEEDTDMIMVLSFSTVMLNTDLHNPAVNKKKKMTEEQFLKQISMIENGSRISNDFGLSLYRSIAHNEIKMATEKTAGWVENNNSQSPSHPSSSNQANKFTATTTIVSDDAVTASEDVDVANGIASSNHSGTLSRLGRAGSLGGTSTISHNYNHQSVMTRSKANSLFQANLTESIESGATIVAAEANHRKQYHTQYNGETVKLMFEMTWSHFYQLATKILETPKNFCLDAVSAAMDILSHSISISLCLGMDVERKAFAMLLAKFYYLYTNGGNATMQASSSGNGTCDQEHLAASVGIVRGDHLKEKWYEDVMAVSCSSTNLVNVINEVHHLTAAMKDKIQQRNDHEQVLAVQNRFETGGVSLMKLGRRFVREGVLSKRTSKKKYRKYQFFLFSDLLIYASQRAFSNSKFHAHQILPLHTMQVREVSGIFSFEVRHPRKSFVVQAGSEEEKRTWMSDIMRQVETLLHKQLATDVKNTTNKKDDSPQPSLQRSPSKSVESPFVASTETLAQTAIRNNIETSSTSLPSFSAGPPSHTGMPTVNINSNVTATTTMPRRERPMYAGSSSRHLSTESVGGDCITDPTAFDCDELENDEEYYKTNENEEFVDDEANLATCSARESDSFEVVDPSDPQHDFGFPQPVNIKRTVTPPVPPRKLPPRLTIPGSSNITVHPEKKQHDNKLEWLLSLHKKTAALDDSTERQALADLDDEQLTKHFMEGLQFSKPILTNMHQRFQASDEDKLLMYAYFKQGTKGSPNHEDEPDAANWTAFSKYKVWESLTGTGKNAAKIKFLSILGNVAPDWAVTTTSA